MGHVFASAQMPVRLSLCKIPAPKSLLLIDQWYDNAISFSYYFLVLLAPVAFATMHFSHSQRFG